MNAAGSLAIVDTGDLTLLEVRVHDVARRESRIASSSVTEEVVRRNGPHGGQAARAVGQTGRSGPSGVAGLVLCHACSDELAEQSVAQPPSAGRLLEHRGGPLCYMRRPIKIELTKHSSGSRVGVPRVTDGNNPACGQSARAEARGSAPAFGNRAYGVDLQCT